MYDYGVAMHDCVILNKILKKSKITTNVLIKNMENFVEKTNYWNLSEMKDITPVTRIKLVKAGISLDILRMTYLQTSEEGAKKLLSSKQMDPLKGL